MRRLFVRLFPSVWICHRRSKDHKINGLHENCLIIIYCDKNPTFEKLVDEDGSITIHKRNLKFLAIEVFKVAKNSAPTTFYTIFQKIEQNIYNLRNTTEFHIPLPKTVYNGPAGLTYLGRKAWNMLSLEYKKNEPLSEEISLPNLQKLHLQCWICIIII